MLLQALLELRRRDPVRFEQLLRDLAALVRTIDPSRLVRLELETGEAATFTAGEVDQLVDQLASLGRYPTLNDAMAEFRQALADALPARLLSCLVALVADETARLQARLKGSS